MEFSFSQFRLVLPRPALLVCPRLHGFCREPDLLFESVFKLFSAHCFFLFFTLNFLLLAAFFLGLSYFLSIDCSTLFRLDWFDFQFFESIRGVC